MKIVVIGGTGLVGSQLVRRLVEQGHEAVAASPSSGVDTLTGVGVDAALRGAEVLVDVSNSPSFEDAAVLRFFETSTRNLVDGARRAGVGHMVALSVVGAERIPDSGYMRAKVAQERLIRGSGLAYTVVRATQFFEFAGAIAASGAVGDGVRLPPARMRPIASADVASSLADAAVGPAANGAVEIAGPEFIRMDELARRFLAASDDARVVTPDAGATYFGARVDDDSLVPLGGFSPGATTFDRWLGAQSR